MIRGIVQQIEQILITDFFNFGVAHHGMLHIAASLKHSVIVRALFEALHPILVVFLDIGQFPKIFVVALDGLSIHIVPTFDLTMLERDDGGDHQLDVVHGGEAPGYLHTSDTSLIIRSSQVISFLSMN